MGYKAGITLKGAYTNPTEVYDLISRNVVPSGMKTVIPRQIHGAEIAIIESHNSDFSGEADGAVTSLDDVCLTVTTADCLPIIFADPASGLISAVHVGWRSFVGGILERYFELSTQLGADINSTRVVIGPGIGSCCFEVGPDVAVLFDEQYIERRENRCFIDLWKAAGNKIESLGVVKANMSGISECTYCHAEKYYSYRRDKHTQVQMVTFIYKTAKKK